MRDLWVEKVRTRRDDEARTRGSQVSRSPLSCRYVMEHGEVPSSLWDESARRWRASRRPDRGFGNGPILYSFGAVGREVLDAGNDGQRFESRINEEVSRSSLSGQTMRLRVGCLPAIRSDVWRSRDGVPEHPSGSPSDKRVPRGSVTTPTWDAEISSTPLAGSSNRRCPLRQSLATDRVNS